MKADATHLTSLFENATEGIVLTNGTGSIVLVNPAAQRMFGYDSNELLGQPIEVLIPKKVKDRHVHLRDGFYGDPQNRVMGHGRDLYALHKKGNDIPVEVSLSFYHQNDELFVMAFIVDITERKKIEQNILLQQEALAKMTAEMRALNAELETKVEERTIILKEALLELEKSQKDLSDALSKEKELSEIKSRFVSMASHEFRTPLSTILSSASLASHYTEEADQEKRDKHLKKIRDSVKHLNDILEDFLSLGKLEEGRIMARADRFHVPTFLKDVVEEISAIRRSGQWINVQCQVEGHFVSDPKLLKNILINLLSNAIKFSNEGQAIDVFASLANKQLCISVSDKGIGISEDDMLHLFSSFYRAKNAVNIQGTGLGLHIVKRYVDLLGGHIEIDSKLNKGTNIFLYLPELVIDPMNA